MPTTLYLKSFAPNNPPATTYVAMTGTMGSGAGSSASAPTTSGGTEIQFSNTTVAPGGAMSWISPYVASPFTLTSVDFNAQAYESNMAANIGMRSRVYKYSAAGVLTELGGGPFNDGVEMGTSVGLMSWTGNVTDTSFAVNDRIVVRFYITNVGTMAATYTGGLFFDGANTSSADSNIILAETVSFSDTPILPSITPQTVDNAIFSTSTPTLEFTGNDNGYTNVDLRYQVELWKVEAAEQHSYVDTFTANGTWTVPTGVTSATFECMGGGAAGYIFNDSTNSYYSGGGGAYAIAPNVSVSAGEQYTITVGATQNTSLANGNNSSVVRLGTTHCLAVGGNGHAAGGTGGQASACTPTTNARSGGNGQTTISGTLQGGGGAGTDENANSYIGGNFFGGSSSTGTLRYGGFGVGGWRIATSSNAYHQGVQGYVRVTYTKSLPERPTIMSRGRYNSKTGQSTSHTLNMPSGIVSGELLLCVAVAGSTSTQSMTGWNTVTTYTTNAPSVGVFYKYATGGDTGTLTLGTSSKAVAVVYRIKNGGIPTTTIAAGRLISHTASTNKNNLFVRGYAGTDAYNVGTTDGYGLIRHTLAAGETAWFFQSKFISSDTNAPYLLMVEAAELTSTTYNPTSSTETNILSSSISGFNISVPYLSSVNFTRTSGTNAGFVNSVNGADTDPFLEGQKINYTIQAGDALGPGNYYWSARAIAPSGANTYGSWMTPRYFTVESSQATRTKTQLGKAAIQRQTSRTNDGKARIQATATKTITGKASIVSLYTREAVSSLPTNDAALATLYSDTDISGVASDDSTRVGISGTSGYLVHQYKARKDNNTGNISVNWNGQSDVAPSSAAVYLQIYNYTNNGWETIASNNTAAANTDFTLSYNITSGVSMYYSADYTVTIRVYQQAQATQLPVLTESGLDITTENGLTIYVE